MVVEHLCEWTNSHSDGWPYWSAPKKAAAKAITHIESTTYAANEAQEANDITEAEMQAAVRPIKAFLTRRKVGPEWRERILRSTQPI
jgi:hypothetical protein